MKFKICLFLVTALFGGVSTMHARQKSDAGNRINSEQITQEGMSALHSLSDEEAIQFLTAVTAGRLSVDEQSALPALVSCLKGNKLAEEDYPDDILDGLEALIEVLGPYINKVLPLYLNLVMDRTVPETADLATIKVDTVYAAPVDEIFYGIGDERNHYNPLGLSESEIQEGIAAGGRVKHNQSYLWGMAVDGDKVYWCTNTNYLCLGGSEGLGSASMPGSDTTAGYMNSGWVCECESGIYGKTVHAAVNPDYAKYSDTRIPRIYCYDTTTGTVEDITPSGGDYDSLLQNCQGLRSCGVHNGIVFFGGPSLYGSTSGSTVGSTFLAYDTEAGEFIGCSPLDNVDGNAITDIRRWYVHEGVLYCGVRVTDANGKDRGAVLRWYGDKTDPWKFKVVGWTANEAAELCTYNGRMYVGGWNTASLNVSTLVKGPVVPEGGLQPVGIDEPEWQIIWKYSDYEGNAMSLRTTYTASIQVWKDKLYWGTFNAIYTIPSIAARMGYTDMTSPEALAFYLGSVRQTSFWRIDADDNIELLYGEQQVPVWNKPVTGEDTWTITSTGWTPVFGRGGFGQPWTAYTWTMTEFKDDLYIGTMNVETLLKAVSIGTEGEQNIFGLLRLIAGKKYGNEGFELLRMKSASEAPQYITINGFGNGTAYGIRNFATLGDKLFVGSASPLNLEQYGGWHLFSVTDNGTSAVDGVGNPAIGVLWRDNGDSLSFATTGGEDIETVTLFDLEGRTLYEASPAYRHVDISTDICGNSVMIATVATSHGKWTFKILR